VSDEQLTEQPLNIDGKFVGKPQPIVYAPRQSGAELHWVTITVMAVLTIVILNMVVRRRRDQGDEKRDAEE
jgi:cytochrome c-type biogenesis protein CcmH/NrfF